MHLEALSIFSISAATALNIYVAVSKKRSAADHPTCREELEALKEETTSNVYLVADTKTPTTTKPLPGYFSDVVKTCLIRRGKVTQPAEAK